MSVSAADGKKLKGSGNATGRKARKASSAVLLSMPEGNWWGKESKGAADHRAGSRRSRLRPAQQQP